MARFAVCKLFLPCGQSDNLSLKTRPTLIFGYMMLDFLVARKIALTV